MSTGSGILYLARQHIGEPYENVQVPKNNANWHGPWDCAEFVSWVVYQDSGILYGCLDDNANPAVADAYTGAWQRDCNSIGKRVDPGIAAGTVGGIVLRFPPQPGTMGHIAICDGKGSTVEAKGHKWGVVADTVHGRRWDAGILIPGIYYDPSKSMTIKPPPFTYYVGGADQSSKIVRDIQIALSDVGVDPGPFDGRYGVKTSAAVAAFQTINGLVADGEVGHQTAAVLSVKIPRAKERA